MDIKTIFLPFIDFLRTRKRLLLIIIGICASFVLILFISVQIISRNSTMSRTPNTVQKELVTSFTTRIISADDLFLPDEPDYLPQIILNRTPQIWTADDAQTYWTDPLKSNTEYWRQGLKTAVDVLLESTP
jgi:hypothetical protein